MHNKREVNQVASKTNWANRSIEKEYSVEEGEGGAHMIIQTKQR